MSFQTKKTVVVGLSGGVDSSVAALLLKKQGYDVIGIFMKNWNDSNSEYSCSAKYDWDDVRKVCSLLDIPHFSYDFSKEYYDKVFTPFLEDYKQGHTPNPDILCNREIKFNIFYEKALSLGADYIATGHYCQVQDNNIFKAKDLSKDQSYFLYAIRKSRLKKLLFPLGNLLKSEVRQLAHKYNLPVYNKKDSTGICFIGERKFRKFLSEYIPSKAGDFCLMDGTVVGKHQGAVFYTIGQRRQLGLGGQGKRWFVIKKDMSKNIVYVSRDEEKADLFSSAVLLSELNFLSSDKLEFPLKCFAKIRYRQEDQACLISKKDEDHLFVQFDTLQKSVALKQSLVFYDGYGKCLGGGQIEKKFDSEFSL